MFAKKKLHIMLYACLVIILILFNIIVLAVIIISQYTDAPQESIERCVNCE